MLEIGWILKVRERTEKKDDQLSALVKFIAIQCDLRALQKEFKTGKQYEETLFFIMKLEITAYHL